MNQRGSISDIMTGPKSGAGSIDASFDISFGPIPGVKVRAD